MIKQYQERKAAGLRSDEEDQYEVEKILKHKPSPTEVRKRQDRETRVQVSLTNAQCHKILYLVQWKNDTKETTTWVREQDMFSVHL